MIDVVMPQMGESIVEGTLTKWLKKKGDRVERDEPLFEISTDKVDTEIPAPASGAITPSRTGGDSARTSYARTSPRFEALGKSATLVSRTSPAGLARAYSGDRVTLKGGSHEPDDRPVGAKCRRA